MLKREHKVSIITKNLPPKFYEFESQCFVAALFVIESKVHKRLLYLRNLDEVVHYLYTRIKGIIM